MPDFDSDSVPNPASSRSRHSEISREIGLLPSSRRDAIFTPDRRDAFCPLIVVTPPSPDPDNHS